MSKLNNVPLHLFTPEALEHPEVRKIFRLQNPGKPLPPRKPK